MTFLSVLDNKLLSRHAFQSGTGSESDEETEETIWGVKDLVLAENARENRRLAQAFPSREHIPLQNNARPLLDFWE